MTVAKTAYKAAIKAFPGIGIVLFVIEVIMAISVSFIQSCPDRQNCSGENGRALSFQNMDSFRIWRCEIFYPIFPRNIEIRPQ